VRAIDFEGIMIKWLGHDSFRLDFQGKVIYIDPFQVSEKEPGQIILVTHAHYDHFSPDDLKKLAGKDTIIVSTKDVIAQIAIGKRQVIKAGETIDSAGIKIKAVPAYNKDKAFHPRSSECVGYIIDMNGTKVYHAGDTDFIPEMKDVSADVAMLPVSGTYVMTAEEAVAAARKIMPKVVIPMHYGKIVGSKTDAEKFKKLCDFCRVEIMD
jgi:L-ascorbate metabolism protein UlaG (beta-lactamase superfamily)